MQQPPGSLKLSGAKREANRVAAVAIDRAVRMAEHEARRTRSFDAKRAGVQAFVVQPADQHEIVGIVGSVLAHEHEHQADLGNIGKAHLATSCNAAAQKEIDHGDALIHSFWYAEADKSFRRAADADPKCGMAWWGAAMSNLHPIWAPPTPAE